MDRTTFVVKTLERPEELARLLRSLRSLYPNARALVADDARDHARVQDVCSVFDARLLELPHDVGLSVGRNTLLAEVETETFVLLDDDFVMIPGTRVEPLVRMVEEGLFDIAGGLVLHDGSPAHFEGRMRLVDGVLRLSPLRSLDGCPIDVDFCWNFWVGRAEAVRRVLWDERLKVCEHHDFFLRCRSNGFPIYDGRATRADLRVGYYPGTLINHIPGSNPAYAPYRHKRNGEFWSLVKAKYGIREVKGSLT